MDETRSNGFIQEFQNQLAAVATRAASLAGELKAAQQRIQSLTEQAEKQAKELDELKPKEQPINERISDATRRGRKGSS